MLDVDSREGRRELRASVRAFLETRAPVSHARQVATTGSPYDRELWRRLAREIGAAGLLVPERLGGHGGEFRDVAVVLMESGRVLLPSPLLSSSILAVNVILAGAATDVQEELLPAIAQGDLTVALAHRERGPGWLDLNRVDAVADQARVSGEKDLVLDGDRADRLLVLARGSAGRLTVGLVDPAAGGVEVHPLASLDGTRRLGRVTLRDAPFRPIDNGDVDWTDVLGRALAQAGLALACEAVGGARRVLETTLDHVRGRQQFGRPIGSYQAVKHALADLLTGIELSEASIEAAIDAGPADLVVAASVAKLHAVAAFVQVAREGLHLHGGIGFTAEHDSHLFLRRAKASEFMLGSPTEHRRLISEREFEGATTVTGMGGAASIVGPAIGSTIGPDEDFRHAAREWIAAHAKPRDPFTAPPLELIREMRTTADVDEFRVWNRAKYDAGWAGITWPRQYGGRGESPLRQSLWRHEIDEFETPEDGCIVGPRLAGPVLLRHASPEQLAALIPAILTGEHVWTQLFSEPEAGSDLAGIRCTATADGDSWIVNGQKVWSSVAQFADRGLLLARTDRDAPRHRGLTCFVIDMATPGITVRPIAQINGESSFNEVFLDDVRLPADAVIGSVGDGWRVAIDTLTNERVELGAARAVNFIRLRHLAARVGPDGRRAGDDPALTDRLVDLFVRWRALIALGDEVARLTIAGLEVGPKGNIVKLVTAAVMNQAADLALELEGDEAVLAGDDAPDGGAWQQAYLSVQARRIAGGTDEIQRNVIAERYLGLPR